MYLVQLLYFTNLDFPEIRGFAETSATFWGENSCEVAIIWPECTICFHVDVFGNPIVGIRRYAKPKCVISPNNNQDNDSNNKKDKKNSLYSYRYGN